jgi:hypothetical protein
MRRKDKAPLVATLVAECHDTRMRQAIAEWRSDPTVTTRTYTRQVRADGEFVYVTALIVRRKAPKPAKWTRQADVHAQNCTCSNCTGITYRE